MLLVSTWCPLSEPALHANENSRLEVTVFKYYGGETEKLEPGFEQFKGILDNKLRNMVQEFLSRGEDYAYLSSLKLHFTDQFCPSSLDGRRQYMAKTTSLELLSGTVFLIKDTPVIQSTVHFSKIDDPLSESSINIVLKVVPEEFRPARDSHSMVTLFALAMDAKRMNKSTDIIVSYLSKAYSIAADMDLEQYPALELLKERIEKKLESYRKNGGNNP